MEQYKHLLTKFETQYKAGKELLTQLYLQIHNVLQIDGVDNPLLQSQSLFLSTGERMITSPGTDWVSSLLYPNEVCKVVDGRVVRRIDTLRNIDVCFNYRDQPAFTPLDFKTVSESLFNTASKSKYQAFYNFKLDEPDRIKTQFYYMLQLPAQYTYEDLFQFMHQMMMSVTLGSKVSSGVASPAVASSVGVSSWRNVIVRNSSVVLSGVLQNVEIDGVKHGIISDASDTKVKDCDTVEIRQAENLQIYSVRLAWLLSCSDTKVADCGVVVASNLQDTRLVSLKYALLENCVSSSLKHVSYLQAFNTVESYTNGNTGLYISNNAKIQQQSFTQSFITIPQNSILYTADSLKVFHTYVQFECLKVCQPTVYCVNLALPDLWKVDPSFCYNEGRIFGYVAGGVWQELTAGDTRQNIIITHQGAQVDLDEIVYTNRNIRITQSQATANDVDILIAEIEDSDPTIDAVYFNGEPVHVKTLELTVKGNLTIDAGVAENLKITGSGGEMRLSGTGQPSTLYFYNIDLKFTETEVPIIRKLNNIQFIADNLRSYDFTKYNLQGGLFSGTTLGDIHNEYVTNIPSRCFFRVNWKGDRLEFPKVTTIDSAAFLTVEGSEAKPQKVVVPNVVSIGEYAFYNLPLYSLQRDENYHCVIGAGAFYNSNLRYINLINTSYPEGSNGRVVYNSQIVGFVTNNSGNTFGQLTKCQKIVVYNIDSFNTHMIKLPSSTQYFTSYKHLILTTDGIFLSTEEHYDLFSCQVLMIADPQTDITPQKTVTTLVVNKPCRITAPPPRIAFLKVPNINELDLPGTIHGINMERAHLTADFTVHGFEFICKHLRWKEGIKCNLVENGKNLVNFNISLFTHQTEFGLSFVNADNVVFDEAYEGEFTAGVRDLTAYVFPDTRQWVEEHAEQITSGVITYVDLE